MKASIENPIYSVSIVADDGTKYNITGAVESVNFQDPENQFAQSATIRLKNMAYGSSWLSSLLKVRSRVYIYANDGERNDEVFRGFIWTRSYATSATGKVLQLKCYDHLIYLMESEDAEFFAAGKSTKDVVSSLCSKWGIKLDYTYGSITHDKLPLRGYLSDVFTADVLDLAKDRIGKKYVIRSEKDVMKVMYRGQNETVYTIATKKNALSTASECTMDGMITKVVILGKANDDDHRPVEATVDGKTSEYGTLQKLINRDENTSLADAKKEAQNIINEDGTPKWKFEVTAPDIPWIRKGDKVKVSAGDLVGSFIVSGIDRDINNTAKEMTLTMERA